MSAQIHEFDPHIYPRLLWVTVGAPYEVIKGMFEEVPEMEENADAQVDHTRRTKPDVKGGVLIRFANRKAMTQSNITHEATHAAMEIFYYIGAYPDPKNQEPFAYLSGWIAKCIQEVKQPKRQKDGASNQE